MIRLLVSLYRFFQHKKVLFYAILALSVGGLAYTASKVQLQEDISRFLPNVDNSGNIGRVFKNMKVTDKLVLVFTAKTDQATQDSLVAACDDLTTQLLAENKDTYIKAVMGEVGGTMVSEMSDYLYSNLPIFLTSEDYRRIDSLLLPENVASRMRANYSSLLSPSGMAVAQFIAKDPLGIGFKALERLRELELNADYELYDGHIFSADGSTLIAFITPVYPSGNTQKNGELISRIEEKISELAGKYPNVEIGYFGGPAISASNAKQVKADTLLTSIIALIVIITFISLAFRRKTAIPIILLPVAFGALFALAIIALTKGEISAIAIGAGSAILGIALSYTIHVMVHFAHTNSPEKVIKEIALPLTIGSFTTVGAFIGLVFTSSEILRDFGLFSAYTLIGTTLFCLIFLPHFLRPAKVAKQNWLYRLVERANGYAFEKNRWIVAAILVATVIGWFASQKIEFEPSLDDMYYKDPRLFATAAKLDEMMGKEMKTVYFVSVGSTYDSAYTTYKHTAEKLAQLRQDGLIAGYSSTASLLIPPALQQERIARWNAYWTKEKQRQALSYINAEAHKLAFRDGTFSPFADLLGKVYTPVNLVDSTGVSGTLGEWITVADGATMLVNQVQLSVLNRDAVYEEFTDDSSVVVLDSGYYTKKMMVFLNQDFNLVLLVSSVLVFVALLISYGRIELAMLAFLPMAISWIIILGLFALLGIKLNIINIIISTFIFGIGDDFSIFVMDGLQMDYERGRKSFDSHKTAIFYSAFTILVGVGVLIFAKHPALYSVAVTSFVGLVAVVFVVYTIQPFLFNLLIGSRVKRGLPPYTLKDLLLTAFNLLLFLVGCILLSIISYLLALVPLRRERKEYAFRTLLVYTLRGFMWLSFLFTLKKDFTNSSGEDFSRPSIIIANHQSVIDILVMLMISPKVIILTNRWVWRSPFFGRIVRYAGYYCVEEGYENAAEVVGKAVSKGYSVAIFPEGTRSATGEIKRFHKGAFYLADKLGLDIVPVLLHGNHQAISKGDLFFVSRTTLTRKIAARIAHDDRTWGVTYQERGKLLNRWFREEYEQLAKQKDTTQSLYFRQKLIRNYIYKGPILEWYLRVKARMEGYYATFDRLIPTNASVCDIGCGYGFMAYMLSFTSKERTFTCIDYDEGKVTLARHCFSHTRRMRFIAADASEEKLDKHDVFVINDMLHYLPTDKQLKLLNSCVDSLNEGGMIVVRDGDASRGKRHRWTRRSEQLSTRLLSFNKTNGNLHFIDADFMASFAKNMGLDMKVLENDSITSNTIFILTPIKGAAAEISE